MRRLLLLTCLLIFMAACQYDPHAHLYTTEKPAMHDVVGVYTLKSETLFKSDMADLQGRSCSVRLRADGTFEATNVPPRDVELPGPDFFSKLRSGSGTWRVDVVGTVDNGWRRKNVWGVYLDSSTATLAPAYLIGRQPPYGLIFSVGDPDSGEAMILERTR